VLRLEVEHHAVHRRAVLVDHDATHAVVVAVLRLVAQAVVKVHQTRRKALVVTKWKVVRPFASC